MVHSIGYLGRFERSFEHLAPGTTEYLRVDGTIGKADERPANVDGVFFGYMQTDDDFVAVRAQYEDIDVVVTNPVRLVRRRHTDGKGFGPNPSRFGDKSASRLLADLIAANPQVPQFRAIVERLEI
jgi:hypothetical protein